MSLRGLLARLRRRPVRRAGLSEDLRLVVGPPRKLRGMEVLVDDRDTALAVALHRGDAGDGVPLPALVEDLRRLDGPRRAELHHVLVKAVASELGGASGPGLARNLQRLRDGLRDPLPVAVVDPTASLVVNVDAIKAVDESSFWVLGWIHDEYGEAQRLDLVSPEGQRADLLTGAYRFRREDVEGPFAAAGAFGQRHGFMQYVQFPAPSPLRDGWLAELANRAGERFQLEAGPAIHDPLATRSELLTDLVLDRPGREELRAQHGHQALSRLQQRLRRTVGVERVLEYGPAPDAPEVTIVVPLFRRIDLLQHQLAHFAHDEQVRGSDLVYVLDSPELAAPLTELAGPLHELHGIPFRIAVMSHNAGYALANNEGVQLARAPRVLLLNSDVIPVAPGWLGAMRMFFDATQDIGALGPKLLYEDDSIQHAGMYFERDPQTGEWDNQHYFKGFSRSLAEAAVSRPVPAVTGACMMVDRGVYEELGGFDDSYVAGGYEDSDFSIRLLEAGRRNWYLADVELFHLEAQSYPSEFRTAANAYNRWLQTSRWDEHIDRIMRGFPEAAATGPVTVA